MSNDESRVSKFETLRGNSTLVIFAFILVAYLVIGALYAVKTPAWQVPDEPAHYNYIRHIAEGRGLPVLQPGDYNQDYLERIKAAKFPPSMPVDSIRYESWQPPLYYLLAAPVHVVTSGSLFALRLFSVVLGGGVVLLAFLIVHRLAPDSPASALGTAAFVAFVPQHVAMMAGVQNDSLAELLLAVIVLQISNFTPPKGRGAGFQISKGRLATVGVLLGLALVTKGMVYIAVPLVAIAIWLTHRAQPSPRDWKRLIKNGALVFVPALMIALPLWIRNIVVYGWPDFLASIRHDVVVLGQPTPAEWITKYGLSEYLRQFVATTFQSFWGQFGWMGVPMNGRYYAILAVVSLVSFVGLVWYLNVKSQPPQRTGGRLSNFKSGAPRRSLKFEIWILIFWVLFALTVYVGYNAKYVQFQGRYLFPALIPIGLAFTVGLRQWTMLLPRAWRGWALTIPYVGLAVLDVIALFRMIVPTLAP